MTDPAAQARTVLSISTLLSLNEHQKLLHGRKKNPLKWEKKTLTVNRLFEVTTKTSLEGTVNCTSGHVLECKAITWLLVMC